MGFNGPPKMATTGQSENLRNPFGELLPKVGDKVYVTKMGEEKAGEVSVGETIQGTLKSPLSAISQKGEFLDLGESLQTSPIREIYQRGNALYIRTETGSKYEIRTEKNKPNSI